MSVCLCCLFLLVFSYMNVELLINKTNPQMMDFFQIGSEKSHLPFVFKVDIILLCNCHRDWIGDWDLIIGSWDYVSLWFFCAPPPLLFWGHTKWYSEITLVSVLSVHQGLLLVVLWVLYEMPKIKSGLAVCKASLLLWSHPSYFSLLFARSCWTFNSFSPKWIQRMESLWVDFLL